MAAIPFPVVLLFNFFFISFFYLIAYSLSVGIRSPKVKKEFATYLKGNSRGIAAIILVFAAFTVGAFVYMLVSYGIPWVQIFYVAAFPIVFAALVLFLHYGKFIEKEMFKKRIRVKDLVAGDVPVGNKWKVLSEKEVRALKRRGGSIWIKEGIRFAPVFVLTMILSLFVGNLVFLLFSF